jgi:ABC-type sugar transport system ATPase subunit
VTVRMARANAEAAGLAGRRDGAVLPLAVDLRGAHKSFGSVQAVRGVALAAGAGEVMAFLGPNGAGKTSAIDMILGISAPMPPRPGSTAWRRGRRSARDWSPPSYRRGAC